jgi:hypothetical protein
MGCTFDNVMLTCENKEIADKFAETFNRVLTEDLYYGKAEFELFSDDNPDEYITTADAEPMFYSYEDGSQVEDAVCEFAKENAEEKFTVEYNCTFSNCGDALYIRFEYKDNCLTVTERYANADAISYCEECDADFDEPLCFLDDYDPDEEYVCSECGAMLKLDFDENIRTLTLINGEWIEEKEDNI